MADAQNERTTGQNRRRRRRRNRGRKPAGTDSAPRTQHSQPEQDVPSAPALESTSDVSAPKPAPETPVVRPANIQPPTVRSEEYCVHHMASVSDIDTDPLEVRTNMTTLRHLQVDHFGEATLFCDCLHSGPHQWPPSMQKVETAIELDQFLADSTNEA